MKHEAMIQATADGEQVNLQFEGKGFDLLELAAKVAWRLCYHCKSPVDIFCDFLKYVDEVFRSEGALKSCTTIDLAAMKKMGGMK